MNRQSGFSLIEVLVALLLTSIGVLGMVILQSRAVINASDAAARDSAVTLVNELIEIMRSHRDELYKKRPPQEYAYSQLLASSVIYTAGGSLRVDSSCSTTGAGQSLPERAGCWLQKVERSLPAPDSVDRVKLCPSFRLGADGAPECAGSGYLGSAMAVQITWRARKEGSCSAGSYNCSYVARVEL